MNTPNQETVNLEIDFSHRLSYPLNSLHEDELLETLGHMLERVQNVTELMTYYIEVPTEVLISAARVANLEIRDCRSVLDAIDEARMQSKTPPKVFTNDEIEELINPTLTKKQMDEFEAISSSDYIKQARQQVLTACTLNITEFRELHDKDPAGFKDKYDSTIRLKEHIKELLRFVERPERNMRVILKTEHDRKIREPLGL